MSSEENTPESTKLSVVIIGRNEEQFIAQSIQSALAVAPHLPRIEVIFADSASTDRSVEIAKEFPIRILQLKPDWPLCVAAGRYIGYLNSDGEYVLFLDGDAEVQKEWVVRAVAFMDSHLDYGAVAGVLDEEYIDEQGVRYGGVKNVFRQDPSREVIDCKILNGIALYRRLALEKAGTVNPHLPTAEDHELCLRIRNAGFKLAQLPGRMAIKYTEKRDTLYEIFRRSRGRMLDFGAVIRYCSVYGCAWQFCVETHLWLVTFTATTLALLIALPFAIYFELVWLLLLVVAAVFSAVVLKKRSIRRAFLSSAYRAFSAWRTIISFVATKPKPIEAYPTDVIHISPENRQKESGTTRKQSAPGNKPLPINS